MKDKKSVKREVRVLEARDLMKATGGSFMGRHPQLFGFPSHRPHRPAHPKPNWRQAKP